MGDYDREMKLLVDSDPKAIARFVLREWRKQGQEDIPEEKIEKVIQLNGEFEGEKLKGDGLLLVHGPEGPLYLIEIEFQSKKHS
jgi:hypothetical protein